MFKRKSCANSRPVEYLKSACSTYKQNMEAIGFFLDNLDATEEVPEEFVRRIIMKYGPFCNIERHFKSDCTHFCNAMTDSNFPRHEEALSGAKIS